MQAAVVEDAAAVEGERLVLAGHVGRDALRHDRRVRDRQLQLVGDDRLPHRLLEELDLAGRVVGDSEGADLARRLEVVERARHLVGLDERVGAVQQQHVEVVGAERGEGALDRLDQVLVREVEVRPLADDAGLGLDGELLALRRRQPQGLGEAALAAVQVVAVHVGVVDEVDARVACGAHELADGVVVQLLDAHEAEHDVRDLAPGGAQGDGSHGSSSIGGEVGREWCGWCP